jgi:protein-tyrosine phosphatase
MIDIHSHILPGIDDGAKSLEEALDMLRIAIDQGVTTQVLTPHIHIGRFNNTKQHIEQEFIKFQEQVDAANLPIKLLLGAELRIGPEIMQFITTDNVPWLGNINNQRTFLLEFPRTEVPFGSDNLVRWLISKNCLPIIVHPERNSTFLHNRDKLQTFIDLGCPLQLTSSSLTGKFGIEVQKVAEELLIEGNINIIASDCHNLKGRSPDLKYGKEIACKLIGNIEGNKLIKQNPEKFLTGNLTESLWQSNKT